MKYISKNTEILALRPLIENGYAVQVGYFFYLTFFCIKITTPINKDHYTISFDSITNYWTASIECRTERQVMAESKDLSEIVDEIKENEMDK